MRVVVPLLILSLAVLGCQSNQQAQSTVDSLQAANQSLERDLQIIRDSLQRAVGGTERTLDPPVYFPSGSAWLFDDVKRRLDEHAQTLKQQYPNAEFSIKGYTDNVPIGARLKDTYPSNWYLSAQRAAAVAHYLNEEHGIRTPTLEIEAFGPKSPVAPNETPEGRRKNRRVEIVVQTNR